MINWDDSWEAAHHVKTLRQVVVQLHSAALPLSPNGVPDNHIYLWACKWAASVKEVSKLVSLR